MEVVLLIKTPTENFAVTLKDTLTLGRTDAADVFLNDGSLSRRHATFEILDGEVWVFDEDSLNGTFVRGERVSSKGCRLRDGDEILLGNDTSVLIEIHQSNAPSPTSPAQHSPTKAKSPNPKSNAPKTPPAAIPDSPASEFPMVPILAGIAVLFIILSAGIAVLLLRSSETPVKNTDDDDEPKVATTGLSPTSDLIPVRVIDPFAGQEIDIYEELLSEWEVQDTLDAKDIEDIKVGDKVGDAEKPGKASTEFLVTREFWEKQKAKAMESRGMEPTGERPAGMVLPPEFAGKGVAKQSAKLAEMIRTGYKQPMDFSDLAAKRLAGELVEVPLATETYLLEVGSNANENEFTGFDFERNSHPLEGPRKEPLLKLGTVFSLDLSVGTNRKQTKMRLLRMFHPRAKPILLKLAQDYYNEFKRPLRITSLTRSMEYQISLNKNNPNSFKVRGAGSLPPHTSGCAFDLARKHMSAREQNFVMNKLAEQERAETMDAIIEYNANACFHVFIYPDGKPAGR